MCRLRDLCSLHQVPVPLQPEQQAANRKLLEELQAPLIHAWQLDGGKGYLDARQGFFDARMLRVCLGWGLKLSSRDAQGRTLLHSACMVRLWDQQHLCSGACSGASACCSRGTIDQRCHGARGGQLGGCYGWMVIALLLQAGSSR